MEIFFSYATINAKQRYIAREEFQVVGSKLHNPWHRNRILSNYFRHRAANKRKNSCALAICKQSVCQQRPGQFITPSATFAKRISPRSFNPTSFFLFSFSFLWRSTIVQGPLRSWGKKNMRADQRWLVTSASITVINLPWFVPFVNIHDMNGAVISRSQSFSLFFQTMLL